MQVSVNNMKWTPLKRWHCREILISRIPWDSLRKKRKENKTKTNKITKSMVNGLSKYFRASFFTQPGIVAEKSMLWRLDGSFSKITSTSSSKPTASIWSASSRTKNWTSPSLRLPPFIRSIIRPGVPTTTSTPRESAFCCVT